MKRVMMLATLMLCAMVTTAHSEDAYDFKFNARQKDAMWRIHLAYAADQGCPRYESIRSAVHDEMLDAGMTSEMADTDAFIIMNHAIGDKIEARFNRDASRACREIWSILGRNGTYLRQMVQERNRK